MIDSTPDDAGSVNIDQESLQQKLSHYADRGVSRIKLGLTDIDGVIRGKYVGIDKFISLLKKQGGFCDCVFGWDVDDQLYDSGSYTGWHTGFPDTDFGLVVETERWLPDENCPYFIGEFVAADNSGHPLCPRTRLKNVLAEYGAMGLSVRSGFEYEFFVFQETPHSVREKGYRQLIPLTPGNFGYSVLRSSVESDRFSALLDYCRAIECDIEGLHCETGPGVWEAALKSNLGIEAADRAALFKTFTKVFFQRQDLIATFMAKWSMDYPGQSGHFHFSVADADGNNPFYDAAAQQGMSAVQRHAVAGLQRYLPECLSLLAPTINSYTRLVKGAWAPTAATWGVENRTAAIRVVPGDENSQRIECRVGGADGNPYLVAAGILSAALEGIKEKAEPGERVNGNAYDAEEYLPAELKFASNLAHAADALKASSLARKYMGDNFVDHFVSSRHWEVSEYQRSLNSWQLERYFEII
jgi:glutamine synthetase